MAEAVKKDVILVAVDGSRVSRKALDIAVTLAAARNKHLIVYHVWSRDKPNAGIYNPQYLEIEFTSVCYKGNLLTDNFDVIVEERIDGYSISKMILDKVNELGVTLLCLGAFGRKGPSVWSCGSNANHSLRNCPVTVLTAKANSDVILSPFAANFMVGHDGSVRAQKAMEIVKRFSKPQDQVVVVNIVDEWLQARGFDVNKLLTEAKAELEACGVKNVSTFSPMKDRGMTIGQQIIALANDWNATYLVVGLDGMTNNRTEVNALGSVTDFVVQKSRCTSVVAR